MTLRNFTLLAASSLTVMAGATIAPALPSIRDYFALQARSPDHLELYVRLILTLPALATAATALLAGYLIDRWGRKPFLLGGLLLYVAAGCSGLVAQSLAAILVGRALLGVAVAFIMTTSTTLISDFFQGQSRERFLGQQSAAMALGGMLFVTLGGLLADEHWRAPFAVYALALLVFWAVWQKLPRRRVVAPRDTGAGAVQAAPITLPRFLVAVVYTLALIAMLMFYLIPVQLPFFMDELGIESKLVIGLAISVMTLFGAFTAFGYGWLRRRARIATIFLLMFVIVTLGYAVLAFSTSGWMAFVATPFFGMGFGLLLPNCNVVLAARTPEALRGRVFGGLNTCFFLGQFLSPIVVQPILLHRGLTGWDGLYGFAALLALTFGMATPFLRRRLRARVA